MPLSRVPGRTRALRHGGAPGSASSFVPGPINFGTMWMSPYCSSRSGRHTQTEPEASMLGGLSEPFCSHITPLKMAFPRFLKRAVSVPSGTGGHPSLRPRSDLLRRAVSDPSGLLGPWLGTPSRRLLRRAVSAPSAETWSLTPPPHQSISQNGPNWIPARPWVFTESEGLPLYHVGG